MVFCYASLGNQYIWTPGFYVKPPNSCCCPLFKNFKFLKENLKDGSVGISVSQRLTCASRL